MSKITDEQYESIDELFDNDIPEWLQLVDTTLIRIRVDGDWNVIRPDDVKEYFEKNHGMSGMRYLGDVSGDWRPIDNLAETCEAVFNVLCPGELSS